MSISSLRPHRHAAQNNLALAAITLVGGPGMSQDEQILALEVAKASAEAAVENIRQAIVIARYRDHDAHQAEKKQAHL